MIPIVVVSGLVIGRWWCVPVLALAWSALLYADGASSSIAAATGGAALAAINGMVAVGVRRLFVPPDPNLSDRAISGYLRRPDTTSMLSYLRLDPSAA